MHVEHHRWYSDRVGRHMEVAVFGHYGVPVLVFPTSNGTVWEYRDQGFVGAVADFIEAGRVKLFTVSANQDESWMSRDAHPLHRSWSQARYDAWVRHEAVPFVWNHCRGRHGITALGASLGAYYAANATLKHPDVFDRCLAFSGIYDMAQHMDGHFDLNLYFNNPPAFVPNLNDHGLLEALRRARHSLHHRHRRVGGPRSLVPPRGPAPREGHPRARRRLGPRGLARLAVVEPPGAGLLRPAVATTPAGAAARRRRTRHISVPRCQ